MKKALIQDHCLIRLLPYHPQVWVTRAATFLTLGYGELAAADAYKAQLLCNAASVDAMKAQEPGDGSLTAKVLNTVLSKLPQAKHQSSEVYYLLISSSIKRMQEHAFLLMAQGLMCISAWYDALNVLQGATKAFPENGEFKVLLVGCKQNIALLKEEMNVHGKDIETIQKTLKRGRMERVAYPWIVVEELERSVKGVEMVKAHFEAASKNACISKSPLDGNSTHGGVREESFGVFAKRGIQRGETILFTRSIWAGFNPDGGDDCCSACCQTIRNKIAIQMSCCTSKFCSESCKQEATKTYHHVVCGKDFSWLYQACKEADPTYSDMVPLMMVKVLATAIHLNCKPLKVSCIGTLKSNYDNAVPSNFRLFDNIIAPIQILQTLGVDVFTKLNFDSWALQTLIMRIDNNKVGKKTLDNRRYSSIDPLFCMFNHSCIPSATFNIISGGTAMTVTAVRDIEKGEEICISYVEPWLPERERRDKIWKHIGRVCECLRCKRERETEERQRVLREKIRDVKRAIEWNTGR